MAHGCGRSPAQLCLCPCWDMAREWSVTNQELWVDIPTAQCLSRSQRPEISRKELFTVQAVAVFETHSSSLV